MPRYVDADSAKAIYLSKSAGKQLDRVPTADVQEVKHGKWVEDNDGVTRCSNCGAKANRNFYVNVQELSDYCPHCGAKMDDGE